MQCRKCGAEGWWPVPGTDGYFVYPTCHACRGARVPETEPEDDLVKSFACRSDKERQDICKNNKEAGEKALQDFWKNFCQ